MHYQFYLLLIYPEHTSGEHGAMLEVQQIHVMGLH